MNQISQSLGPLDSVLFTLVIVAAVGSGLFQGWFEGCAQQNAEHKRGLALPRGKGPILDFLCMIVLTCSVPFVLGIPTHVYQYGTSILAAGPAIILAQVSALFIVLPVFGKANKDISSVASSAELVSSASIRGRRHLSLESYIRRRFRSSSLNVLVAILIFALWTLISASILYAISGVFDQISPFGPNGSIVCTMMIATFFTAIEGKSRILWTDLALTMILIGGLLTIFVTGSVESGGMSAVIQKARLQGHFQLDSFSFSPTAQDSYISAFFGHFMIWLPFYASFYAADCKAKASSSICVAILHTPFTLLILATLTMIGLVLAITPENNQDHNSQQQQQQSCGQPDSNNIDKWPDQRFTSYILQWLGNHHGLAGFSGLFLAALTAHSLSIVSTGFNNLFYRAWASLRMDESACLGSSSPEIGQQMFVRISASASTLMAGSLVFAMAGSTDVYEVVLKSTGILLGTLIAIYLSGLFLPFAKSGKALVFASLISLTFGHWMSIGSMVHFSHQPVWKQCNNPNWLNTNSLHNGENAAKETSSYTTNLQPNWPSSAVAKEDYPSHIPVTKTKSSDTKSEPGNSMLPRAPVSNWIDPRDIKATLTQRDPSNESPTSNPGRPLALESSYSTNSDSVVVSGTSQDQTSVSHPRTPVTVGGSESSGQQYTGNKPPLISGSPIYGVKVDEEKTSDSSNITFHMESDVSSFYKISGHLFSLVGFCLTFLVAILASLFASQVSTSPDGDSRGNFWLLHPTVTTLCCYQPQPVHPSLAETLHERRKSQMIEDPAEAAVEVAKLIAHQNSLKRNGHELERKLSRNSRRSHRSSLGGGSNNGSYQGASAALTTTTAEVLVTPAATTIEHLILERRMSQLSNQDDPQALDLQLTRRNSSRSPRPGSFRKSGVPSPTIIAAAAGSPQVVVISSSSPKNALLLAPPTDSQLAQRRFSEVNAAIERHSTRRAAKRSQSVMYRQNRRRSTKNTNNASNNEAPVFVDSYEMMHRRRSVKM